MNYKDEIRNFIRENFNVHDGSKEFSDDDNYFELKFVNSLFAMRLVNFIEQKFCVQIENEDLVLENFSSVNNLMNLINRKKLGAQS